MYRLQGDFLKAIGNSTMVYELMKKMFGKKDPKTNKAFKNLGVLYKEHNELKKALSIFKKH